MNPQCHAGRAPLQWEDAPVSGELTRFEDEDFYKISNFDRMRPFFMTIVSDADHWMFISSTGALTAGRRTADSALFPYYTDDKIHDSADITGSTTSLLVDDGKTMHLWMPFSSRYEGIYKVQRNLYKSLAGNKLVFEEINEDLSLAFRYGWFNSRRFGFVRRCWLQDTSGIDRSVRVLDGIQNIMPSGIGSQFQLEKSTLLDAYKRSELSPDSNLALFSLSSIPIDKPEPAEALTSTVAWSSGLEPNRIHLLPTKWESAFRATEECKPAREVRGERGAYLLDASITLTAGTTRSWMIVADVEQSHATLTRLRKSLRNPGKLERQLLKDIDTGTHDLRQIVGAADGLQSSAATLSNARHYANVMFNVMRGGVFASGYDVDLKDLRAFVGQANKHVAKRHARWFDRLPRDLTIQQLTNLVEAKQDPQLERICKEYLPLTFSRRHGDPSRPWNRFAIPGRDANGNRVLNYEGNWRDIFQNWEALALSFPAFAPAMVCKFVNASTADGYNPYRVTRDGLDWEVVEPHDPWSFIGYWGDHQIIYLLKLLEIVQRHEPASLQGLLNKRIFAFADVPYRIKDYAAILANPKSTVDFDEAAHARAREREQQAGSDGKLVWNSRGEVHLVNLAEKLLIPVLTKLTNFVPDAGIWLNTQRPEWNDANNALVGNGTSMVTLFQMRRHLSFLRELFSQSSSAKIEISQEVFTLLKTVKTALAKSAATFCSKDVPSGGEINSERRNKARKQVVDELGQAGSAYRNRIYAKGFSSRSEAINSLQLTQFLDLALTWIDASIQSNKRADGLYESYNLIRIDAKRGIEIRRLYPMLEGQAAVLASGFLSATEALNLLQALRHSALYRADQHSYVLYPDRDLQPFLEKNQIAARDLQKSALLQQLIKDRNTDLIEIGSDKVAHFNGGIRNEGDVAKKLDHLARNGYARLVKRDRDLLLHIFENLFDHETFTGRSGTFFAYEGLGSIYWHMVSKLLLSVQEACFRAAKQEAPQEVRQGLAAAYYDIRSGLGDSKNPAEYGAFPMDPYSHTPKHKGASQPGLTGQVKEDILCRWGELGLEVEDGRITIRPWLLRRAEFREKPAVLNYFDVHGEEQSLALPSNSIGFTYCQVPFTYLLQPGEPASTTVTFEDRTTTRFDYAGLDEQTSRSLSGRDGKIKRITVKLPAL